MKVSARYLQPKKGLLCIWCRERTTLDESDVLFACICFPQSPIAKDGMSACAKATKPPDTTYLKHVLVQRITP